MGFVSLWDFIRQAFKIQLGQDDKIGAGENTMHATLKLTKRINEIAKVAYDKHGYINHGYDEHQTASGCFRVVFIENGVAIKLVRQGSYANYNRAEWDTYRKLPASVKAITAKPICISACSRVMAIELVATTLGKRKTVDPTRERAEFNARLKKLLLESGLFPIREINELLSDNHANNIGVRENGELVWIDYAGC